MLEISIIKNGKTVWEFNREQKRDLNKFCGKILNSKNVSKVFILIIASILTVYTPVYATGLTQIDVLGNKVLGIMRQFGYYVCVIMATKEIIQSVATGSYKDITQIIVKYVVAFAGFYSLPWIFDFIKGVF